MPGVCRFTTAAALFTDITRTVEVGNKVIISVMFFSCFFYPLFLVLFFLSFLIMLTKNCRTLMRNTELVPRLIMKRAVCSLHQSGTRPSRSLVVHIGGFTVLLFLAYYSQFF